MQVVAIIDDGLNPDFCNFGHIYRNIIITPDLKVRNIESRDLEKSIHGNICAAIIKKYYDDVAFVSIKVLSKTNNGITCNKDQLIKAIEFCISNKIKIINLSLGTIDYRDFEDIKFIINKAYDNGLIIIAACSNKNVFTYPAACSNVIGVKAIADNKLEEGKYIFNLYPIDGIEIMACGEHKLFDGKEYKYTNKCNSYAAPMITAKVCKIIDKKPNLTLEMLKLELYKGAINFSNDVKRVNNYTSIDWIDNLIILNMRSNNFEVLSYLNGKIIFENFEDIKINLLNTLIILFDCKTKVSEIQNIINQVESKQKNIVLLSDGFKKYEILIEDNVKLVTDLNMEFFLNKNLERKVLDIPLIIFGGYNDDFIIKSLIGLRQKFKRDGYNVGILFTEPIGILFNFQYISMEVDIQKIKKKIQILHRVYNYDVIILGIKDKYKNINVLKRINTYLEGDIILIQADEKISIDNSIIISSQDNVEETYDKILRMLS